MSLRTLPIPRIPLRSEQLIDFATRQYVAGNIDVDELEQRVHRALTGEATDKEWIDAARYQRFTAPLSATGSITFSEWVAEFDA